MHVFDLQSFLQLKGIISQHSCPYTPQQNRVVEHKNQHLLDVVHILLLEYLVPPQFWVEALPTVIYLINHLPSQTLNLDPLFIFCLESLLTIILFMFLVVFALFTYLLSCQKNISTQ